MTCHWCKFYRWRATFSIMKTNLKIFRERENHLNANVACSGFLLHEGLGGKRGAEVRGHGVWKTRGLSEKHEKTIISLNEFSSSPWEVKVCYFKLKRKSIGVKRVFRSWKRINHFGRKKKHSNANVRGAMAFLCMWWLFHFSQWLA